MAYVDTGLLTKTAPTVLFLHGNPTSSYIYRNIVPHVSPIARCIVPDLVGFGDSGKMPSNAYYVRDHILYFAAFMDAVVPKNKTEKLFLVLHDWGSAIGLDWGRKNPTRVEGVSFMEYVYEARREALLPELRETFEKFRAEEVERQLITEENMFIEGVLGQFGTARGLTEAEMQHYRRPFLKKEDREPMYRFPNEIPVDGEPEDAHIPVRNSNCNNPPSHPTSAFPAMDSEKTSVKDAGTATSVQAPPHKLRDPPNALRGWRLHVSMLGLCLGLFCSALETTVIATSLTAISTHFSDAARSTWIVTTYLVTYSGFLLVFSKLSDIFTPRNTLLAGFFSFALFSGLCAASHSMDQLIVFRAFQGVGGSVIFSLAFVTVMAVCPMRWMGFYSGVSGTTFAIANVAGPLLGGKMGDEGAWRWIFLLNVPAAAVAAGLVGVALPGPATPIVLADLVRVDYVGAIFSVSGAVLLIYGLETGGSTYTWGSGVIVGVLAAAVVAILLFFGWEWRLDGREGRTRMEPLFPFRLLRNPVTVLIFLSAFFLGAVFYTVIITLPRRSQLLYSLSATAAGVKLLAMLLLSSFSSAIAGLIYSKSTRLVLPILAGTTALQVLGGGLLCTLGFSSDGGVDARMSYHGG
ncbi:putative haloalkane dehalogenase protein [Neofusicoccum parvum UCRNP2]|uniref:Putative haloalkane dehalogenase protein n=1 Tax=Botryosphaeria parva (strain UCR-NP2) TaxID=1287680 RepID=R1EAL2_BOTPV|nr:putative haloalkane dehalogenase protein [Neofusicoccum parvum UCRNP2]